MRTIRRAVVATSCAALIVTAPACDEASGTDEDATMLTVTVAHRDLIVQVSATGRIVPPRVVEVKSKASGELLDLPVETGAIVTRGALLARLDTAEASVSVRQAQADLDVASARHSMAERRMETARQLSRRGMIADTEEDDAELAVAVARANVVKAETELQRARERLAETVVRAPISGTILSKHVERGQIIASATREISGGTTLLEMADLTTMEVRALVDESDVGRVHAGQLAQVRVEAYPDRSFAGPVVKIEPVGRTSGDVTFFPVIVHLENTDGVLRPGMHATVSIDVERREGALSVPVDALVVPRDAEVVAPMFRIPPSRIDEIVDSATAGAGSRTSRVLFMYDSSGVAPVVVETGAHTWDHAEIMGPVEAGQEVVIPPSATIAREFQHFRERTRRWSALPGLD